ncbi:MAG: 4-hydroxy-tetrahydrodipicolinate synthase [Clostridia bacterium]|nr:4-hydroxy-tetrahydrodipicolinate synthase [Clostridia bacterium]
MKKKVIFKGVATALITPFSDGEIDYSCLERLIEFQIYSGIDAIVIGGTTGEAATLSNEERYKLFREAKRMINGRCKLILGTGTNDTRVAKLHTEYASRLGCDGVLLVTPYYNRGTKDGVIKHYLEIAEVSEVPMLLYNVPGRTGVNLSLETLEELRKCEKIVGIKEASDSDERLVALSAFGDTLHLYAGNDSQIFSTLSLGGLGVVSVLSNLMPKETRDICKLFFTGRRDESLKLQQKLLPVINSLFLETNPAPIKYAMSRAGMCSPEMRLPMWLPTEASRRRIDEAISAFRSSV